MEEKRIFKEGPGGDWQGVQRSTGKVSREVCVLEVVERDLHGVQAIVKLTQSVISVTPAGTIGQA